MRRDPTASVNLHSDRDGSSMPKNVSASWMVERHLGADGGAAAVADHVGPGGAGGGEAADRVPIVSLASAASNSGSRVGFSRKNDLLAGPGRRDTACSVVSRCGKCGF